MTNSHRVIYVAANAGQAHAIKNLLADHGIAAYVTNDTLGGVHFASGDLLVRAAGGPGLHDTSPCVVVLEENAEEARRIALEAEAAMLEGVHSEELVRLENEIPERTNWPCCPSCGEPRLASCPVCETAGTDFDEAFLPEADVAESSADSEHRKLLVLCPTCDEPFAPVFPARCQWCGHRFNNGYEPPGGVLQSAPIPLAETNVAAVTTIVLGLAALFGLIVGWFYYLLN